MPSKLTRALCDRLDESIVDAFNGTMSATAFCDEALMAPLSDRSSALLTKIWSELDSAQTGSVGRAQIATKYDSR